VITPAATFGTVGGGGGIQAGAGNTVSAPYGTVGGGSGNMVRSAGGTVAGGGLSAIGSGNIVGGAYGAIGGGTANAAGGPYGTVGGGRINAAGGDSSTVGGGQNNRASGANATVAGGDSNQAAAADAAVGGGSSNQATGINATVGGGDSNQANGSFSSVGGGRQNIAAGDNATVPGGVLNAASGTSSFAAGQNASARNDGAFVWGDTSSSDKISSTGVNQFVVRAAGGVWFGKNNSVSFPENAFLATSTGAFLSQGGQWINNSDRNLKENFESVDGGGLLERVASLPILTWNYIAEAPSVRHMGPMAQDFRAAFGLGTDDRHIAMLDEEGVALAAIQSLYKLSQEKDRKIEQLSRQLENLQERLRRLEKQ
jgi:hypothetical protein